MESTSTMESHNLNFAPTCEWQGCTAREDDEYVFYKHVSNHLPDLPVVTDENGEEMYKCAWENCVLTTNDAKQITRHVKYHAYSTILKAKGAIVLQGKNLPLCTYSELVVDAFSLQADPFICRWNNCGEELSGIMEMIHHMVPHMNCVSSDRRTQFFCQWEGCTSTTNTKSKLQEHIKVHTSARSLGCPQCGYLFSNKTKFADHLNRQLPTDESSYQCNYCLLYFSTLRLLKNHERQHVHHCKCQHCGMTCHTPAILKSHIKYRHSDVRDFKCSSCSFSCKSQSDLLQHSITHSNSKPVKLSCTSPECNFECCNQSTLTRHYYKEHSENNQEGGRYFCHLCDKSYTRGTRLTKHLCSVHNLRKPSEYSRFIYRAGEDGRYQLQTDRLESLEVIGDYERGDEGYPNPLADNEDVDNPEQQQVPIEYINNGARTITIEVLDESGEVIISNSVNAEESPPPLDAKILSPLD